jgi:uncharacterized repeat protein (TIGR03803 family)
VHGRRKPRGGTDPDRQRGLLRNDVSRRGQWPLRHRLWDGLQDHACRHADDAIQLLLSKRVPGRLVPRRWFGPGHHWGFLRDNRIRGANGLFYGTIFKITPGGALTTLYSFCSKSECPDGANPYAGLVQATTGDFYGTTRNAGAYGPYYGTIFKITPSGKLTTVYSFCSQIEKSGCTDGANPYAGLVQATNGDFFGTTEDGGTGGVGTVFKITPGGALTTLYSFCPQIGCTDGRYPYAGLVQASNGDFYGTTSEGGANNDGTIFEITPSGTLTTLYSFCSESGCTDGVHPSAALVQASNGDFYGTTNSGGAYGYGTVFEITPSGTLMDRPVHETW